MVSAEAKAEADKAAAELDAAVRYTCRVGADLLEQVRDEGLQQHARAAQRGVPGVLRDRVQQDMGAAQGMQMELKPERRLWI